MGVLIINVIYVAYSTSVFGTSRFTSRYKMSNDPLTNYIYLDPLDNHKSTVIFLHGIAGTSSTNFDKLVNNDMFPNSSRIILANAPSGNVTFIGGA